MMNKGGIKNQCNIGIGIICYVQLITSVTTTTSLLNYLIGQLKATLSIFSCV